MTFEEKMKIVINNYFKKECSVNTSIREAFEKGFCIGVNKMQTKRKERKWIPCSETVDIPEYKVLCCDRYGEELIGYISCSDEQWLCESEEMLMYDPIAWMPLPQPYKK